MTHPTPIAHQLTLGDLDLTYDAIGLAAPCDPAAALAALPRVGRASAAVRWLHGDLVLALIDGDPDRLHEAWTLVADLDVDDRPSLARSVAVALAIPHHRRRPALSWSHHQAVVALDSDDQDRWLAAAEANRWSVAALTGAIAAEAEADREEREPPLPLPTPWHQRHRQVVAAIDEVFDGNPEAVVVLRADGTWRLWGEA